MATALRGWLIRGARELTSQFEGGEKLQGVRAIVQARMDREGDEGVVDLD